MSLLRRIQKLLTQAIQEQDQLRDEGGLVSVETSLDVEWKHQEPIDLLNAMSEEIGLPDKLSPEKFGCASWKSISFGNGAFSLKIRDQKLPHLFPSPHFVYVYVGVRATLPEDRISKTMKLIESLKYDEQGGMLWAGCSTPAACFAMLFFALQIANGHKRLSYAREELPSLMKGMIQEEKALRGMFTDRPADLGKYHQAVSEYLFGDGYRRF